LVLAVKSYIKLASQSLQSKAKENIAKHLTAANFLAAKARDDYFKER